MPFRDKSVVGKKAYGLSHEKYRSYKECWCHQNFDLISIVRKEDGLYRLCKDYQLHKQTYSFPDELAK